MKEFTTLYGMTCEDSGAMKQGMYEVDKINPFDFSCSGRKAVRAEAIKSAAFEKHLIAIVAAANAGVNPPAMLNEMANECKVTGEVLRDFYKTIVTIPTGCVDPRKGGELLNTWYASIDHTSVTYDEFYAAQFWAQLQTLTGEQETKEPTMVSDETIKKLLVLSELFVRATVGYTSPNVLFAIVASALMRIHSVILVPYMPDFDTNIYNIISGDIMERRDAWKRMRHLSSSAVQEYHKEVLSNPEFSKWDSTGCLHSLRNDRRYGVIASLWAGACHRYGFEKY